MIATDADTLLWLGPGRNLMIETRATRTRGQARRRPDGAHARSTPTPTAPSRTSSWS